MKDTTEILGCFASFNMEDESNGALFRTYIWGEKGIGHILKKLKHSDYGNDLMLILFQFYVNPDLDLLAALKEIENYRKKEKSIGIPIVVNQVNFFSKSEEGRYSFLKQSLLQKLDILAVVVEKKKLDTRMDLVRTDLQNLLS
jgi:hypothetical protein